VTLYSYCLRWDDGAAPNPFWGSCTLAICKPAIRRLAQPGDWVVGLGSSTSPIGDISGHVVYAMKVSRTLSMREYDEFCRKKLRGKIPVRGSRYFKKRVGDCIYDFSNSDEPRLRPSVHTEKNRSVDLSGQNVLLSEHFFYFGNRPCRLPDQLSAIVKRNRGHKSHANTPYVDAFVDWIEGLKLRQNRLYGDPIGRPRIGRTSRAAAACAASHYEEDCKDEIC